MPYYATGDYYGRGDYYQGDPGIFGSLASIAGRAIKGAVGLAFPIPTAIARGVVGGAKNPISPATVAANLPTFASTVQSLVPTLNNPMPMPLLMPPSLMIPSTIIPGATDPFMQMMLARGYRLNKSTYAVRGGGTSRWGPAGMLRLIQKGTTAVKSRRMNVANPRALRRGLRRAAGFVKLARRAHVRLAAFTGRGKTKRKG